MWPLERYYITFNRFTLFVFVNRMKLTLDAMLRDEQAVLRKGHGCNDQIITKRDATGYEMKVPLSLFHKY